MIWYELTELIKLKIWFEETRTEAVCFPLNPNPRTLEPMAIEIAAARMCTQLRSSLHVLWYMCCASTIRPTGPGDLPPVSPFGSRQKKNYCCLRLLTNLWLYTKLIQPPSEEAHFCFPFSPRGCDWTLMLTLKASMYYQILSVFQSVSEKICAVRISSR